MPTAPIDVRFRGEADVHVRVASVASVANDPFRTSAVPFCCDARDRCLDQ